MEIDITRFFNECAPMDYSASCAEIGSNAGIDTWNAALDDSGENSDFLDTEEKREAFKDHIRGFGAWDQDEIDSWSNSELTALFMQLISGDMREADLNPESDEDDWNEYQERAENGNICGNIFKSDDGKIYYSLSN